MVKISEMNAIQQKITKLTQDVTYFEKSIGISIRLLNSKDIA